MIGRRSALHEEMQVGPLRFGASLIVSVALASDLRADLSRPSLDQLVVTAAEMHSGNSAFFPPTIGFAATTIDAFSTASSADHLSLSPGLPEHMFGDEPLMIDGPPSSFKLVISGLLAIGAWHGVRSGREIATDGLPLPEWYHDGGPIQIGHATPFDFDFGSMPACCFEQPVEESPRFHRNQRRSLQRPSAQCTLTISAPRGPPTLT